MVRTLKTQWYQYTNPHPKGIKTREDCVIRAISIATGKDWLTVYDELAELGKELLAPQNDKVTSGAYLDKIGKRINVIVDGKRLTGKDLTARSGTYVMSQAHHLVAIKNGKVRDTWDSSNRSGYIVWKITK